MQVKSLICLSCKHWRDGAIGCDAFPEGIPPVIIETNKHDEPLEEQDNKLVFEERENPLD